MPISINIDNSNNLLEGAYFPGEIVRGKIIYNTEDIIKAREMSVNYIGMEKTYVARGSGKNRHTYIETFYYFNEKAILIKSNPDIDTIDLQGNYDFNFEFKIPEDIPPTLKIDNSAIIYFMDVKIDRPMHMDIHQIVEFHVVPNIITEKKQEIIKDLIPSDGSIPQCEITCNGQIFSMGETIEISFTFQMQEGEQKIKDIVISIESISSKTAKGNTDSYTEILKVWKIDRSGLQIGDNEFSFTFEIPFDAPYSINGVLMKKEIFIHVKVSKKLSLDRHLMMPITIIPSYEKGKKIDKEMMEKSSVANHKDSRNFCPSCGGPIDTSKSPEENKFCEWCGFKLII